MELDEYDSYLNAIASPNIKVIGVDTEATGLRVQDRTDKLTGLSLSFKGGPIYYNKYFPFFHEVGENLPLYFLDRIKKVISLKEAIVIHNAKHDIAAGKTVGLNLDESFIYDPMLELHMLHEEEYSKQLDYVSKKYLGEGKYRDEIKIFTNLFGWSKVPSHLMSAYAAKDAELHLRLHEYFWPRLVVEELDHLWPIEQEFLKLMCKIEMNGVEVNRPFCEEQIQIGLRRMREIDFELGFTPSKPSELNPFLIENLGLPILKRSKKTGKPSFDKNVMIEYEEILAHRSDKTAQLVLEYRGWQKTISSFYESILKYISSDGRIRPNFKLHVARTSRLSCERPALQCIPRESNKPWNGQSKKAFKAREGFVIVEFDYSQLEFRLECEYSEEEALREAFRDPKRDVFSEMALELNMPRFATKTFKYATGYGAGTTRIANIFNISEEQATDIRTKYRATYPGIYRATLRAKQLAESRGYVRYWTGRRRHLHEFDSSKAFNAIMQGGAAETVKRVMVRIDKEICQPNPDIQMILQVHDAIWLEMPKYLACEVVPKVKAIMTDLPQFKTPFAVVAKELK